MRGGRNGGEVNRPFVAESLNLAKDDGYGTNRYSPTARRRMSTCVRGEMRARAVRMVLDI